MVSSVGSPLYKKPLDDFTILAVDLITDEIVAELPGVNLKFGEKYKALSTFKFDLPLGDPKIAKLDVIDKTTVNQRGVVIDYKGELVGGGYVTARSFQASTSIMSVSGGGFEQYWLSRFIPATVNFTQVDQIELVRVLLNLLSAQTNGDIGVQIDPTSMSGILIDQTFSQFAFKDAWSALLETSTSDTGFDFKIVLVYDAQGIPRKKLLLQYPRMGSVGGGEDLLFDYPGNLSDYTWPEDGTGFATHMFALGAGEGDAMKVGVAVNSQLLVDGYPRFDATRSYKDIDNQALLNGHAAHDLQMAGTVFKSGTFVCAADQDPQLPTYAVGDDGRFRLTSARHPKQADGTAGIDDVYRIYNRDVDAATGDVTLTAGVAVPN